MLEISTLDIPIQNKRQKQKQIITMYFNQFQKPRKKLNSAISISLILDDVNNFGQIEEAILSKELPKIIEADHFNLKSKKSVLAFIDETKHIKNVQLSVYQEKITTKRKAITYGSSVAETDMDA
ncbi:hypothetical protein C1645_823224 [Glomus cerebriforme]|uniref:Uncharacterized protein n=1 Tax=Glomus cerebriforme TaxID=658196 RepID=A0A397T0V5_9GLOM|nr:hypothetical protein C1645_823224 [Glomus cerebriforme]